MVRSLLGSMLTLSPRMVAVVVLVSFFRLAGVFCSVIMMSPPSMRLMLIAGSKLLIASSGTGLFVG